MPAAQATQTKPACFPEQLLCSATRASARTGERAGGRVAERPVRAAFEHAFVASRLGEHRAGQRDMRLLARMRGAGERDLLVAEAEAVGGAALDQRQGLQRLDRRTRIDGPVDVAEGEHHPPVRVDHGARPAMGGFDPLAAQDFDDDRIGHRSAPDSRQ